MNDDKINLKELFWESLRMYFSPLVGAYKAIVADSKKLEQRHKITD